MNEMYSIVNLDSFSRRDYFYYFLSIGTKIEMTVKLDVKKALFKSRKKNFSFNALLIYNIMETINNIENFKIDIKNEQPIIWDKLVPTFTNLNNSSGLFYSLWITDYSNFEEFNQCYIKLTQEYKNTHEIAPLGMQPQNSVNISSIPGTHFEHFSANTNNDGDSLTTMITLGKYIENEDQVLMPFSIKVHHAIVDGFHLSLFFSNLQDNLNR